MRLLWIVPVDTWALYRYRRAWGLGHGVALQGAIRAVWFFAKMRPFGSERWRA